MTAKTKKRKPKSVRSLKGQEKKYYNALIQVREGLLEQIDFHTNEALKCEKNSSAERSGVSTHMADHGSDNFRHDMELELLTSEGDAIERVEEAITRLLSGEYGICQDCGCTINPARLEAKPFALFCIKCRSEREKNGENFLA